jgi:hypothetical protein
LRLVCTPHFFLCVYSGSEHFSVLSLLHLSQSSVHVISCCCCLLGLRARSSLCFFASCSVRCFLPRQGLGFQLPELVLSSCSVHLVNFLATQVSTLVLIWILVSAVDFVRFPRSLYPIHHACRRFGLGFGPQSPLRIHFPPVSLSCSVSCFEILPNYHRGST